MIEFFEFDLATILCKIYGIQGSSSEYVFWMGRGTYNKLRVYNKKKI